MTAMLCDTHIHTLHSFDSEMAHNDICREYISRGFKRIALTDHYDIDGVMAGLYPPFYADDAYRDFEEAQRNFGDQIEIVWGIELGQPSVMADDARKFLVKYGFQFVIGSVHNLELIPDFIFMNFSNMPEEIILDLYGRYVDLLCDAAAFSGIDTLAHITYPMRYIHRDGRDIDISRFYDKYRKLFHIMRETGVALELNTSGIRKGYVTSPDTDILKLYKDCGGERVTCGSDSHRIEDCGADVEKCLDVLKDCGFTSLVIPSCNGCEQIPL